MITKQQAEAIVDATSYRDWKIRNVDYDTLAWGQIIGMVKVEMDHMVPVTFSYEAPNSTEGEPNVANTVMVAIPLPRTEIEFARALYEVVAIIEEHERREFFRIDKSVLKDRPRDGAALIPGAGQSPALFHPHGINRNKLFHDLDDFARGLDIRAMDDSEMTADAV